MSVKLSKYSDALVCVLYREYLNRRKHGVSLDEAVSFTDGVSIREDFLPSWSLPDVVHTCKTLSDTGLLSLDEADENVIDIDLTDDCIIYMEGRFQCRLDLVLSYLEKLSGIVGPFPAVLSE